MKNNKKYLIALEETRSIIALAASIIIFVCTLGAVFYMLSRELENPNPTLAFFTVISNLLSATGAAFMFPYAVEGIRKKRFVLPRWLVRFQYSGATCVAITMITAIAIIMPTQGISKMMGANFWLHLITPLCTVILFQCVETGVELTAKDMLVALTPFWCYMAVYTIMVVVIGKENGGWADFYKTTAFWPAWVSMLLMFLIGLGVAALMRLIHNKRAKQSRLRIARSWSEDLSPMHIRVEAFGLGRYIGAHCTIEELTVPLDILAMMSEKYDIPLEDLTKAYVKGAIDAINERRAK